MLLRWRFYNTGEPLINFLICNISIFIFILRLTNGIAHDSLECTRFQNCLDSSHTVLRLLDRNDTLAQSIAEQHDMYVKVCFFYCDFLCLEKTLKII